MIDQVALAVLGVGCAWLVQAERFTVRRWACIAGLLSQPFWVYTFYIHSQWACIGLTILYAAAWFKALQRDWIQPWRNK